MLRIRPLLALFCLVGALAVPARSLRARGIAPPDAIDTAVVVDRVQVTAIKQGLSLNRLPVTASVLGSDEILRRRVSALKNLSEIVPNFYLPDYGSRMTSSIYVRGLGARIDHPVMGLNVDNVPYLSKDNYDFDLFDIERIEVLRGPQSTLYGRNTMGGVINVYTLSPLTYEGVRLGAEYGSGNTCRLRASAYMRASRRTGVMAGAGYTRSDGFFTNAYTGRRCDPEDSGSVRLRVQSRPAEGWDIDNTLSLNLLRQGGYPYAPAEGGPISYNDPSGYRRTALHEGLTFKYGRGAVSVAAITSYQYADDRMTLDQDFRPESYFTLIQAKQEHAVTEDVVVRSSAATGRYRWLLGAFGFFRHRSMQAPVTFLEDGIRELITERIAPYGDLTYYSGSDERFVLDSRFRNPDGGFAFYHESNFEAGRFLLTAGLRLDYEATQLRYTSSSDLHCKFRGVVVTPYTERGRLRLSFAELLPKLALQWRLDANGMRTLFVSAAKGYKAGGFNTQMFSEVLQNSLMAKMGVYLSEIADLKRIVSYKPEKSWNYEIGARLATDDGRIRADAALFYIRCVDQQLTVFPEGQTTGRMMTNAGRTRNLGAEVSLQAEAGRHLEMRLSYGFTDARFVEYRSGTSDYAGKVIPYVPRHTLSAGLNYRIPTGGRTLSAVTPMVSYRGTGRIWWDEANTRSQPFYSQLECTLRIEHRLGSIDVWCRNATDTRYDVFYFESIGNAFLQHGRPRTFGVTLNVVL